MTNSPHQPDAEDRRRAAEQVANWLEAHGDAVFAYARRRVENEQAAEELVQETFVAALQNFHQFAGRSAPQTWLIAILRNKLIVHYRQRARSRQRSLDDEFGQVFDERGVWKIPVERWPVDPGETLNQQEFWRVFDDCLAKLPGPAAEAFVLRVLDGLDTEKICKALRISSTNLAVRLHRARMALRNCLEKNWFGDD